MDKKKLHDLFIFIALGLGLLFAWRAAFADTTPTLYDSFAGYVNFVGTQRTLRTADNNTNASALVNGTTTSAGSDPTTAVLSGLPTTGTTTIRAAYLYWAASGSTADYTVKFEGNTVTADRKYTITNAGGTSGRNYFSGVADVTSVVAAKGNGTYTFSGLTASNSSTWSSSQTVLAGWALLVVYENPNTERFRVLNVYEGFAPFFGSKIPLTISNFVVPSTNIDGRLAHLTWEGDVTNSTSSNGFSEQLTFNNNVLSDSYNPIGNQFNSVSTIRAGYPDSVSYGIDFDAYNVGSYLTPGATSASSVYSSGADLVLLSMEVMSVANEPVADLGVTLTRNDVLVPGQTATYTVNVLSNGPSVEPGPITVKISLPSSLSFVDGSGTGWSCTSTVQSGTTTVTCTYSGPSLGVGASAQPLTLTTSVAPSAFADTVTVAVTSAQGTTFDNDQTNNKPSDTYTIPTPPYVFTDSVCTNNIDFGASQPCKLITWSPQTAGQDLKNVYITALASTGRPTQLSSSKSTTVNMQFALSCHNPTTHAGVAATFSAVSASLPTCTANGATPTAWTTQTAGIIFPAGSPSSNAGYTFNYADVGKVELFMRDSANTSKIGSSFPFVVKPAAFALSGIKQTASPNRVNPGATSATGQVFVKASEPFSVKVAALTAGGKTKALAGTAIDCSTSTDCTPNFGKETTPEGVKLTPSNVIAGMVTPPAVKGSFGTFSGGAATGSAFSWDEVGIITLTPSMADGNYLGAGDVTGITSGNVGRFYPDHFDTEVIQVSDVPMDCPDSLVCPTSYYGIVYAQQPFSVRVTAKNGLVAPAANTTENYNATTGLAKTVTLTVAAQPGSTNLPSGAGTLSGTNVAGFDKGIATVSAASYRFTATPTAPTDIYLRAAEPGGSDGVTSQRGASSVEGGVKVVSGRILVASAYGSELLPLPIGMTVQYWNGARYVTSATDSVTSFDSNKSPTGNIVTTIAKVPLATSNVNIVSPGLTTFSSGIQTITLAAPRVAGSVDLTLNTPSFLPIVRGRATFGIYKSGPVIYMREMY